jgi:hypothetical protein
MGIGHLTCSQSSSVGPIARGGPDRNRRLPFNAQPDKFVRTCLGATSLPLPGAQLSWPYDALSIYHCALEIGSLLGTWPMTEFDKCE